MKSPYVNEIEPNQIIQTSFLVQSKEIRQKKGSSEFYLSLLLADRTGELDAKMWDNTAEVLDAFDRDDFVKVKGLVQVFHNRPQLTIHKLRRMDDSEIDVVDYFPCTKRDPEQMWTELREMVAGMANRHLKALVEAVLDDPEIAPRYKRAPAAKTIHHAFLGGLLEHVLSLATLARMTAGHYSHVDFDLVLTGVVLHDIGKIYELNYERGFSYSNDGQLLGHIHIGLRIVSDKLRDLPDFPGRLRSLVEHLILSHHGQLEFGSPKLPQFPEALLLHYLDDMDSKMECMRALIEKDRQVEGCFTAFHPALERPALKKDRYLNGEAEAPRRAAAPAAPAEAKPAASRPTTERAMAASEAETTTGRPAGVSEPKSVPARPVAPGSAGHPLFTPRPDSPFADKLRQALQPAGPKQD
jgi:3'-5' exoribonuclease